MPNKKVKVRMVAEEKTIATSNLQQIPKSGPMSKLMSTLSGYDVHFSPFCDDVPVLQWPDNGTCSAAARTAFNEWALSVFGKKSVVYLLNQKTLVMHPKHKHNFEAVGRAFLESQR